MAAGAGARLEEVRVSIKRWEKRFEKAHGGRRPASADVKACDEAMALHKKYRSLKRALAKRAASGQRRRCGGERAPVRGVEDSPMRRRESTPQPPLPHADADSDSDGSHVSATPVKAAPQRIDVLADAETQLAPLAAANRRRVQAPAKRSLGGMMPKTSTRQPLASAGGTRNTESDGAQPPSDVDIDDVDPPPAAGITAAPVGFLAMPKPARGFLASRLQSLPRRSEGIDTPSDVKADGSEEGPSPSRAPPPPALPRAIPRQPSAYSMVKQSSQQSFSFGTSAVRQPTPLEGAFATEPSPEVVAEVGGAPPAAQAAPTSVLAMPRPMRSVQSSRQGSFHFATRQGSSLQASKHVDSDREVVNERVRSHVTAGPSTRAPDATGIPRATPQATTRAMPLEVPTPSASGAIAHERGSRLKTPVRVEGGGSWDLSEDEDALEPEEPPKAAARKRSNPGGADKATAKAPAKRARQAKAPVAAPAEARRNFVRNDMKGNGYKSRLTRLPGKGRPSSKKRRGYGNGLSKTAHRRRWAQEQEDPRVLPEPAEAGTDVDQAAVAASDRVDADAVVLGGSESCATRTGRNDARAAAVLQASAAAAMAEEAEDAALEAVSAVTAGAADSARLTSALKAVFGHESFQGAQLEVVQRALAGRDCLLVAPTGSGKSVCFQLPAAISQGITLIVSPLLSLVADQLASLPPFLKARSAQVSSQLSFKQQQQVLERVRAGQIRLLYVAPERLSMGGFRAAVRAAPGGVALAAVDEAHCVTEWGHSFRPSYARLGKDLREGVGARCVMALTGSLTRAASLEVASNLGIAEGDIMFACDRVINPATKLRARWCKDTGYKQRALLQELRAQAGPAIVYCFMQWECEDVRRLLAGNGISACAYHAGMDTDFRKWAQNEWLSGKKRVIVATVAFGMGIDRADVRSVIHYSSPKSLENYVQEVGRAGRDGKGAMCVALLDSGTLCKQRALSRSHGVDVSAAAALLREVLKAGPGGVGLVHITSKVCAGMDVSQEEAEGAIAWLDYGAGVLEMLPRTHALVEMRFHKQSAKELAEVSELVRVLTNQQKGGKSGIWKIHTLDVANELGTTPAEVVEMAQTLQAAGEVSYELKDPSSTFRLMATAPNVDDAAGFDALAVRLSRHMLAVQDSGSDRLDGCAAALGALADSTSVKDGEATLRRTLANYFGKERRIEKGGTIRRGGALGVDDEVLPLPSGVKATDKCLAADAKALVYGVWKDWPEPVIRPRAIARILVGVASAGFTRQAWQKKCKDHWGRYGNVDFAAVLEASETAVAEVTAAKARKADQPSDQRP